MRPVVGAIFLHRRNRRAVLDPTEDVDGIRLNIPFSRIEGASKSPCLSFACMVSITISAEVASSEATTSPTVEIDSYSDATLSERGDVVSPDNEVEPFVVQLSILRKHPIWEDFMSHVEKAKAAVAADTTEWPGSRVYIDFDPRADLEGEESDTSGLSSLQISVSRALGLDPAKEFFSGWEMFPFETTRLRCTFSVTTSHTRSRFIINSGHFAVNTECIGFWSRSIAFGRDVCYRVPIAHVKGVKEQDRCKFGREYTLAIEVQGRRDLHIHFRDPKKRDAAAEQVNRFIGLAQERLGDTFVSSPRSLSPTTSREDMPKLTSTPPRAVTLDTVTTATTIAATASSTSPRSRRSSRSTSPTSNARSALARSASSVLAPLSRLPSAVKSSRNGNVIRALFPKAINVPNEVLLPMPSRHFVCLTIGSRGDVQPYIALGKGLQKEGHTVTIVTHEEYKEWVTGFGIDHRTAGGDPGALMKLSVENKVSGIYTTS